MEAYKKTLKTRIVLLGIGIAMLIALLILTQFGIISTVSTANFSAFLRGAELGLLVMVILFFAYYLTHYIRLLAREEKLKAAYYTENDERTKLIMLKTGGSALYVCAIAIMLSGMISAYFNETVFFSLTGCALFLFIVRKVLMVYYAKKL